MKSLAGKDWLAKAMDSQDSSWPRLASQVYG